MTRIHAASSTSTAARSVAVAAVFMLSLFQPAGVSAPLAELICAEPAGAVVGVTWTVRVVVCMTSRPWPSSSAASCWRARPPSSPRPAARPGQQGPDDGVHGDLSPGTRNSPQICFCSWHDAEVSLRLGTLTSRFGAPVRLAAPGRRLERPGQRVLLGLPLVTTGRFLQPASPRPRTSRPQSPPPAAGSAVHPGSRWHGTAS
jgi:hypothetical protein